MEFIFVFLERANPAFSNYIIVNYIILLFMQLSCCSMLLAWLSFSFICLNIQPLPPSLCPLLTGISKLEQQENDTKHGCLNMILFSLILFTGEFGTVAGWGRLSEGGVLPSILQHVGIIFSFVPLTEHYL